MRRVCFYVSGHGFGHSARVQAMAQHLLQDPDWAVELRTSAPRWFYSWMLSDRCFHSEVELDPGVVQRDAFHLDLQATWAAWSALLARADEIVEQEARWLQDSRCSVVVSDIVPLACAAARRAQIPCIVSGNFTWDWILADYLGRKPEFGRIIDALRGMYQQADLYLRQPMSPETQLFAEQQSINLVARRSRLSAIEVRHRLGLRPDHLVVALAFGGLGIDRLGLDQLTRYPHLRCLWDKEESRPPALISTRDQDLQGVDLIQAANVVLTKPGYSVIAEAVAHKTPLIYTARSGFAENALLEAFLSRDWPSLRLPREFFTDGSWVRPAVEWTQSPHLFPKLDTDGAAQAAAAIRDRARST